MSFNKNFIKENKSLILSSKRSNLPNIHKYKYKLINRTSNHNYLSCYDNKIITIDNYNINTKKYFNSNNKIHHINKNLVSRLLSCISYNKLQNNCYYNIKKINSNNQMNNYSKRSKYIDDGLFKTGLNLKTKVYKKIKCNQINNSSHKSDIIIKFINETYNSNNNNIFNQLIITAFEEQSNLDLKNKDYNKLNHNYNQNYFIKSNADDNFDNNLCNRNNNRYTNKSIAKCNKKTKIEEKNNLNNISFDNIHCQKTKYNLHTNKKDYEPIKLLKNKIYSPNNISYKKINNTKKKENSKSSDSQLIKMPYYLKDNIKTGCITINNNKDNYLFKKLKMIECKNTNYRIYNKIINNSQYLTKFKKTTFDNKNNKKDVLKLNKLQLNIKNDNQKLDNKKKSFNLNLILSKNSNLKLILKNQLTLKNKSYTSSIINNIENQELLKKNSINNLNKSKSIKSFSFNQKSLCNINEIANNKENKFKNYISKCLSSKNFKYSLKESYEKTQKSLKDIDRHQYINFYRSKLDKLKYFKLEEKAFGTDLDLKYKIQKYIIKNNLCKGKLNKEFNRDT